MASVLVSPHLNVYDATVLIFQILCLGTWVQRHNPSLMHEFWNAVYLLCLLLLVPTAWLVRVQGSVLVMIWVFCRVARAMYAPVEATSNPLSA